MSIRTTIIDEIIDVLRDISGVGEVDRRWKAWDQTREFPACFITGSSEDYEHRAGISIDSSMDILITGYIRDEDNPDEAIDDHLSDVIIALGNLDRPKFLVTIDTFGRFYKPYGIFELTFRVDYEFTWSVP